jgi:DNA-binding NarL/FixJ family response regulator
VLRFMARELAGGSLASTFGNVAESSWRGKVFVVRILVVDDNPSVRHYLRAILEQQSAWQVCGEARTGAEALHQVLEAHPDLILLDYQMPDLNGVDVARQISELFPEIPILMVTLHLSKQLSEAARLAGVRGACAKQDIGSVVEAVEVLLRNQTYFPAATVG